jgi:hypothetical protein
MKNKNTIAIPLAIIGILGIFFGVMGVSGMYRLLNAGVERQIKTDYQSISFLQSCLNGYIITGLTGACLIIAATIVYTRK